MSDRNPLMRAAFLASVSVLAASFLIGGIVFAAGQGAQTTKNSYMPIDDKESFTTVRDRMVVIKPEIKRPVCQPGIQDGRT